MKLSEAKDEKKKNMLYLLICEDIAELELLLEDAHRIFDDELIKEIKERKKEAIR